MDTDDKCVVWFFVAWLLLGIGFGILTRGAFGHEAAGHPVLAGWAEEQLITEAYGKRLGICPELNPNNVQCKCCANSEIPKNTQYRLSVTEFDERGYAKEEWWYKREGYDEWRKIPEDIIHWGEPTPDGQPVLFLLGGRERCFFPGKTDL